MPSERRVGQSDIHVHIMLTAKEQENKGLKHILDWKGHGFGIRQNWIQLLEMPPLSECEMK